MLVNPDFNASQPRVLHGNLGLVHFTILVLGVYQISYPIIAKLESTAKLESMDTVKLSTYWCQLKYVLDTDTNVSSTH